MYRKSAKVFAGSEIGEGTLFRSHSSLPFSAAVAAVAAAVAEGEGPGHWKIADCEVTARQSEGRRRFFYVTQSSTLPNDPNLFRGATGVVDTERNRAREQDREFIGDWRPS